MVYLGIDFGLKHLGLAIADGPLAEPLAEMVNNDKLIIKLTRLIKTEGAGRIVIGLPEGSLEKTVRQFGRDLAAASGCEVIYQDEVLSTREAKRKMIEAGIPQLKRRHDHQAAAALILQEFLDMLKPGR